jgi:hypothetical protein
VNADNISIEDYLFKTLGIDKDSLSHMSSDIFQKNFTHLMCHVIEDIQEIENRINDYQARYHSLENVEGNDAEFKRRKLKYFCDLSKQARDEITDFIAHDVSEFLRNYNYDTLQRECERDGLSNLSYQTRYKYALHRKYYSIDFPYGVAVKIEQYVKEKYDTLRYSTEEDRLITLYKDHPNDFRDLMHCYVDNDHVMENILQRVSNNYHLSRRSEVFETLKELFDQKKYQSFIALGLIQIEGLFYDYCIIHYGESENQGTLIEKARKTLETNEYTFLKMYPYFAFDISLLRNEAAHKGIVSSVDAEDMAYNLVLDLNTLSQMVKSESYDKFIPVIMTHEDMIKWTPDAVGNSDALYDQLLYEFLSLDKIANTHFWKLLKEPEKYKDEIEFYRVKDLPAGMIDLPGIVGVMSALIKSEGFWRALHRLLNDYTSPTFQWRETIDFAKRMRDDYIADLVGGAKSECIEVSKILNGIKY